MDINIAILLTCFNRREKTLRALTALFRVSEIHNGKSQEKVNVDVFLTDDGCTDGTADAVLTTFSDKSIYIVKADGNAYWAGGMRLAWEAALKDGKKNDFYLLINDDTEFKDNCLDELLKTHQYAIKHYKKGGVYTGFVSDSNDENVITYGAREYGRGILHGATLLLPTGIPQECYMTNGNILMVANDVVESIGILDNVYIHAAADVDYGVRAKKAGFPVLTTSVVCGYCENDHDSIEKERDKVLQMNLKQRKAFIDRFNIKQYHDSLVFLWRNNKVLYVMLKASYFLNLYWPSLYYKLYCKRVHL